MLTANEIKELKTRIKSEMSRRSYYGSLSEFAGSNYDFTIEPATGETILAEHG